MKEGVEEACYSILRPPSGPICKLMWVQQWADDWQDDVEDEFFQAFHHNEGECNWTVVIWFRGAWFLRYRDDG